MIPDKSQMAQWIHWITTALKSDQIDQWDSLIINRRKPETLRLFRDLPNGWRVCLHKFEKCKAGESFAHPHAWPAEFLVLEGSYTEYIYYSGAPQLSPNSEPLVETLHGKHSWHKIDYWDTWHKIAPLETTYTVMLNGPPYQQQHSAVRTTKGKDLDKLTTPMKAVYMHVFRSLLNKPIEHYC